MKTTASKSVTVTEAAAFLGVDPSQVRRYIRAGILEAAAVTDRLYLVPVAALKRFARPALGRRKNIPE